MTKILDWFSDMSGAFRREWRSVVADPGVLVFFLLLPLAYPLVYTLIYNPEVVRDMPVAVIDNSRTEASRTLVRAAEASPAMAIYAYCTDKEEARRLFAEGKVFGIMEIPADYSQKIVSGEQATVPFFTDTSLLLRYRTFVAALTDLQLKMAQDITAERVAALGATSFGVSGLPISNSSHFLGDPSQGFASFVMPGVLILILQQSMVIGICMLAGGRRERRERLPYAASASVWGRALCYVMIYIPLTIYAVEIVPGLFNLPHIGSGLDASLFLFPMLLASAMFGQALGGFCSERESSFLVVVFSSIMFIFLSGLTWPRYAMSGFFIWLGNLIPSTWGIDGFIRINSNAASLSECSEAYAMLWILVAVYAIASTIIERVASRKDK